MAKLNGPLHPYSLCQNPNISVAVSNIFDIAKRFVLARIEYQTGNIVYCFGCVSAFVFSKANILIEELVQAFTFGMIRKSHILITEAKMMIQGKFATTRIVHISIKCFFHVYVHDVPNYHYSFFLLHTYTIMCLVRNYAIRC